MVHLYNLQGQLVFQQRIEANKTTLSFQDLPQGMYWLKVEEQVMQLLLE